MRRSRGSSELAGVHHLHGDDGKAIARARDITIIGSEVVLLALVMVEGI